MNSATIKRWVKWIIPAVIVVAIFCIWQIKTHMEQAEAVSEYNQTVHAQQREDVMKDMMTDAQPETAASLIDATAAEQTPDFGLRETQEIDFEELSSYGIPIIVDYGADSCIPCKEMAPVLEKANATFSGKAFVKFVNVWDYPDAANNVPVSIIPTQILFNADGTPFVPSDDLAEKLDFTLYVDPQTNEHHFTAHVGGLTEEEMWAILAEMGVTE